MTATTHEIELTEHQMTILLRLLQRNEAAVGYTNAVRWTEGAAGEIADLRADIEDQAGRMPV